MLGCTQQQRTRAGECGASALSGCAGASAADCISDTSSVPAQTCLLLALHQHRIQTLPSPLDLPSASSQAMEPLLPLLALGCAQHPGVTASLAAGEPSACAGGQMRLRLNGINGTSVIRGGLAAGWERWSHCTESQAWFSRKERSGQGGICCQSECLCHTQSCAWHRGHRGHGYGHHKHWACFLLTTSASAAASSAANQTPRVQMFDPKPTVATFVLWMLLGHEGAAPMEGFPAP